MLNKMQTLCIVNIASVDDEQVSNANLPTKASRKRSLIVESCCFSFPSFLQKDSRVLSYRKKSDNS